MNKAGGLVVVGSNPAAPTKSHSRNALQGRSLPITTRDIRPMNVYDAVPPEGRAGIAKAQAAAAMVHLNRRLDAVIQADG